jgi:hypothetical protein
LLPAYPFPDASRNRPAEILTVLLEVAIVVPDASFAVTVKTSVPVFIPLLDVAKTTLLLLFTR